jgi:hypothetical protein
MTLQDTVPIVFDAGAYGTYLEWVLTTLTTDVEIVAPFETNGSSHQFSGNHLRDMSYWNRFVNSKKYLPFVRIHPKTKKSDSIVDNLNIILSDVDKIVYLYPDSSSELLVINNFMSKTFNNWQEHFLLDQNLLDTIRHGWDIDQSIPFNQIPIWVLREFLSFYLIPSWRDQVEWYLLDRWTHPKCKFVLVRDLLTNFEASILNIKHHCNLTFVKDISVIEPYHNQMLSLQKYLDQDFICHQIVDSTVSGTNFVWSDLPLPSQSWVQWKLRELGYELRCNGLDIFPSNSIHLQNLLYKV